MGLFRKKPSAPVVDPAEVEALRTELLILKARLDSQGEQSSQVAAIAERVATTDNATRGLHDRITALDSRLTSVSTELTNQLTELGRDIDALAALAPNGPVVADPVSEQRIDEIRDGQVRLAAEQARYEIAFRQDLATLAEQIRSARR
ncbi:MAG: hypothetical protein ACO3AV_11250 [Ilumatobacteraceae bacterium]|jgi:hypothetical protein